MYGYYGYYGGISSGTVIAIVVALAALVGLVLFFTLFRKRNEKRLKGFWKKAYDFFHFNRFYTEDVIKLLYTMSVFAVTCAGIAYIVMGSFMSGILWIVAGNLAARLMSELAIILMVMVRRLVSIDRRVAGLENYFSDDFSDWESRRSHEDDFKGDFEDDLDDEEFSCSGSCADCTADCTAPDIKASVIYAGHVEKEKLSAPEEDHIPDLCKGCEEWDEVSSDCYAEKCIKAGDKQ